MPDQAAAERRRSERRPLEFQVGVYSLPGQGRELIETTVLRDISGTGVSFLSSSPDLYRSGQEVTLEISMPGTERQDAIMECQARVIRVDHAGRRDERNSEWIQVGVSMSTLLSFRQREQEQGGGEGETAPQG